jgi:hypothetical protein
MNASQIRRFLVSLTHDMSGPVAHDMSASAAREKV